MLTPYLRWTTGAAPRRGMSIVELLVGIAVSLVVVGGALAVLVSNLTGSRQVLAETRLNQDLRAAMDLVTRDLRRAGYWGDAIKGTQAIGTTTVTAQNPYSIVTAAGSEIAYRFARNAENNILDADEQFSIRLNGGALQMDTGTGTPVDLTDTTSLTITSLTITPTVTQLSLADPIVSASAPSGQRVCQKSCPPGMANCPTVTVRKYIVVLQGQSATDATVRRTLRSEVRVRNDQLTGACPL